MLTLYKTHKDGNDDDGDNKISIQSFKVEKIFKPIQLDTNAMSFLYAF